MLIDSDVRWQLPPAVLRCSEVTLFWKKLGEIYDQRHCYYMIGRHWEDAGSLGTVWLSLLNIVHDIEVYTVIIQYGVSHCLIIFP